MKDKIALIGVVAVFAVLIAGIVLLFTAGTGKPAINTTITQTGSSLMEPLFASWVLPYSEQNPSVLLTSAATNSGTGIKEAASGQVSIGASDAYLPAGTRGLLNIPLAVAAVAVDYHVPGVTRLRLNGNVLAGMYSGQVRWWDAPQVRALNPQVRLPHLRVVPLERSDSSGSTDLFTTYLAAANRGWPAPGKTIAWPPGGKQEKGSDAMVRGLAATRGGVAYIGVSYTSAIQRDGLGTASLENASGKFVKPTRKQIGKALADKAGETPPSGRLDLVNARQGYPVINYEYAIVKTSLGVQAGPVRRLLRWTLTTGSQPRYLTAVGFVPLPANVRTIAGHLIGQVR